MRAEGRRSFILQTGPLGLLCVPKLAENRVCWVLTATVVLIWARRPLLGEAVSMVVVVLSSMALSSLPRSLNVDWIERSCYLQIPLKPLLIEFEKKPGGLH